MVTFTAQLIEASPGHVPWPRPSRVSAAWLTWVFYQSPLGPESYTHPSVHLHPSHPCCSPYELAVFKGSLTPVGHHGKSYMPMATFYLHMMNTETSCDPLWRGRCSSLGICHPKSDSPAVGCLCGAVFEAGMAEGRMACKWITSFQGHEAFARREMLCIPFLEAAGSVA